MYPFLRIIHVGRCGFQKTSWENWVKLHRNYVSFQFFLQNRPFKRNMGNLFWKSLNAEIKQFQVRKIFVAWSQTGKVNVPFGLLSECSFLTIRISCFWLRESKIIHTWVWLYCTYSSAVKRQFNWLNCILSSIFYFLCISMSRAVYFISCVSLNNSAL